jgi:hypothetical protein
MRDLRAGIEDTLDAYEEWEADYNHRRDREAENLRNLQHLPGADAIEAPTTTLEQVRTPRFTTLETPAMPTMTTLTRLRRSQSVANEQPEFMEPTNLNQRQLRELRRLADFNQVAVDTVPDDAQSRDSVYAVGLFSDIGEPKTVKQALKRPDADKWRESIRAEINNFQKCNAWKLVPMSQ